MKPIIVATDFSASAEYAMQYAARLATQLHTSLYLLHTYQMPVSMSDMPVMMVSVEELKNSTDRSLQQAAEQLQKSFPGLEVQTEGRLGDLVEELNELCDSMQPFAVVLGTKGYKGIEKLLFGNTPISVIRHCHYPVIAVPEKATAAQPTNIVLATDLQNLDEIPAEQIISLVRLFGAKLHLVHIRDGAEPGVGAREALIEKLSEAHPVFHSVTDDNVVEGLQRYVDESKADLLMALPHKHNLYERMFFRLHTEGLIDKSPVPVMCLQKKPQ